ncbi:MAG: GTPase HflX [Spirochaetota bacterium]|nr:GTPase HflX [Spirochaetota bacterium]
MDASVNRIPSSVDEKAFLIGIVTDGQDIKAVEDSLAELDLLVSTAGAVIIESTIIKRKKIDPAHIIGKGYLDKLKDIVIREGIRLIVFDLNKIRPAQVRNLEELLKCRIIGRTEVILDIFAQRARSAEAKIQVELAQLKYILPRIKGLGGALSRLGGGIGTRGPGEKMIETDRRHILRRISKLDRELRKIAEHRSLIRKSRSSEILGAVVGYTNAGKSTLINVLAKDDLFVENRLFATLDAFTRTVFLDHGKKILLTDTIGFIRNLPANLIESFKSTLEEIQNADFLIHLIDITSRDIENNIKTVENELLALECLNKPNIMFFNKIDSLQNCGVREFIMNRYPYPIIGSAIKRIGIDELRERFIFIYDSIHKSAHRAGRF